MNNKYQFIQRWHSRYTTFAISSSNVLLLPMRMYWGNQFFPTGWGKLNNLDGMTAFFDLLGVPFPAAGAALVGSLETIGGLFLIVGLASRYITVPLIVILGVAYATDDSEALMNIWTNPESFLGASPFLFLLSTVLVFAFGPGIFSLDTVLGRLWARRIVQILLRCGSRWRKLCGKGDGMSRLSNWTGVYSGLAVHVVALVSSRPSQLPSVRRA